jgi:hypothetical protein
MKNGRKREYNKTEESIFTLLSLYVLIKQAFESLTNDEEILLSEFNESHSAFKDLVNDTVHEALVYQILLKSCAFIEEWNKVFGVLTEPEDKTKILMVKRIAKPSMKCVAEWKNLREFRNEAIAHNHRNKDGKNIYLNYPSYHSPQSNGEIFLLVYCLKKMIDIVDFFFKEKTKKIAMSKFKHTKMKSHKLMSNKKIKLKIRQLDEEVASSIMRIDVLSILIRDNV